MSFPRSEIISLLDIDPDSVVYNLAESTSKDLTLSSILPTVSEEFLRLNLGYGSVFGEAKLRELIAFDANGGEEGPLKPENVLITVGTASGLFMTSFHLFRNPVDEAIIVSPNFPPSIDGLTALKAKITFLTLTFENKYKIDFDQLETLLNENVKLISIPSPSNPTGVCVTNEEIQRVVELVRGKSPNAYILVDETYRDAAYDDTPVPPSTATINPRIISLSSVSKALGIPGVRIGWLISQDPELIQNLVVAKLNILIACSSVDEYLARVALEKKAEILKKQQKHLSVNLAITKDWVAKEAAYIEWVHPDRGALCCVRLRKDKFPDEARVAEFYSYLKDNKVMLAKGSWFRESDRCFRLGFGYVPAPTLVTALCIVSNALTHAAQ